MANELHCHDRQFDEEKELDASEYRGRERFACDILSGIWNLLRRTLEPMARRRENFARAMLIVTNLGDACPQPDVHEREQLTCFLCLVKGRVWNSHDHLKFLVWHPMQRGGVGQCLNRSYNIAVM